MTTQWQSATEKEMASVLLQGPRRANYYSAHVPCPGNPPGCRKKVTHFSPCMCRIMWSTRTQLVSPWKIIFDILLPVLHLLPCLNIESGTVWMLHKILCNITTRFMGSAVSKSFIWTFHRQRNGCRESVWDTFVWRVYSSRLNIDPILNPFSSQAPLEQFFCDTLLWFIQFYKQEPPEKNILSPMFAASSRVLASSYKWWFLRLSTCLWGDEDKAAARQEEQTQNHCVSCHWPRKVSSPLCDITNG